MPRAFAVAVLAFAAGAFAHAAQYVTDEEYLDIVEAAVRAYPEERLLQYVAEVERRGVEEHGFPRLAANLGVLLSEGRMAGRKGLFRRMMDVCCREAKKGQMKLEGNEFSVKELVAALLAVERAGLYPKEATDAWRRDLAAVDPRRCYKVRPKAGDTSRSYNWCVFGAASEQARIFAHLGGDAGFVEKYVADQIRWFDSKGMWRDPHEPAVYDIVTRLQFALILTHGYDGQSRAELERRLDCGAEATLAILSAAGEIPYGGRSNQFLHNDAAYAALCEWYAARAMKRGDAESAASFRLAAKKAVDSLRRWLAVSPVRHVKNRYPCGNGGRGTGIGCEDYAYFDKYMVTMGSWAVLARSFADHSVPELAPRQAAPSAFATSPHFHFVFLEAGEYSAQFNYIGKEDRYDCSGLGRIHRRGAPPAICLSTPCVTKPAYLVELPNGGPLAIAPVAEGPLVPVGSGSDDARAWACWTLGELEWKCELSAEGLCSTLKGPGAVAMRLPAFEFDGEGHAEIKCDGKALSVVYGGWTCAFETDGAIAATGQVRCNRNGRYRVYEARGKKSLVVNVAIRRNGNL